MGRALTKLKLLAATVLWLGCWTGNASPTDDGKGLSASPAAPDMGKSRLTGRESPASAESPAPTLPPCAQAGPPVSLPSEFPKNFPLPPGTVITASRGEGPTVILKGFVPMELREATRFFVQNLPTAGFRLGRGDVEPAEAESRFGGNGVVGFFKLRSIENCPHALEFTIRVQSATAQPE